MSAQFKAPVPSRSGVGSVKGNYVVFKDNSAMSLRLNLQHPEREEEGMEGMEGMPSGCYRQVREGCILGTSSTSLQGKLLVKKGNVPPAPIQGFTPGLTAKGSRMDT
ncbi:hypothetical protein EYF80_021178 [Liparis tanakae]|uniref:Uncharacterized protein n=1 Tax=Liparis tanakae TaxID=230148 RepID=A0A4Z2HUF7_9TELE|nr:hypothetical protein EYF80_021178 [Liparis tanakae]